MNILHICGGGDIGGAKTHVISLLSTLMKDHNVMLVSLRSGVFSDDAIAAGIPTVVIHSSNYVEIVRSIRRLISEQAIQIIHCHGTKANLAGLLLQTFAHIPVVTTVHSDYRYDYMGSFFKRCTLGLLNTFAIHRIKYRIAVSDLFTELLIDRGFDPTRIYTINNSLEFPEQNPFRYRASLEARRLYLQSYGLSCTEKTVIVGIAVRFHPVKDVSTLIRAFSDAVRINPDLRLLIGGCGVAEHEKAEEDRLHALVHELDLEPYAAFTGWVKNIDDFFDVTDISVLCSLSEGFPYSVLESISRGAAVLCSRVGILPRIIDQGINGFLFDPGDIDSLKNDILKLAEKPELRIQFASAQYEKCRAKYSLATMTKEQTAIYESILRRAGRPKNRREGITVCGAYGFHNSGDEAILWSILRDIRSIDPDLPVTVISKDPKTTRRQTRCRSVYTFSPIGVFHALSTSRLYINGGGTLMQDRTSTKSLMYYLMTLQLAKMRHTPVMLYGSGIGPISRGRNPKIAGYILNKCTDIITLRDEASYDTLQSLGVTRPYVRLTGDPAISFPGADSARKHAAIVENGIDPEKQYLCVSLRDWDGFNDAQKTNIAEFLDLLTDRFAMQVVFLPMCYPNDVDCARDVAKKMQNESVLIRRELSAGDTHALIAGSVLVLSQRLHALIFALSQHVPAVGITYDIKVQSFLEYAEKPYFVSFDDCTVSELLQQTERAVADTSNDGVQHICARERLNVDFARALLSNGPDIPRERLDDIY